jgi:hypothetical protein
MVSNVAQWRDLRFPSGSHPSLFTPWVLLPDLNDL